MRAYFEKFEISDGSIFSIDEFILNSFDAPWHYHPQLELTLIISSKGKRYVGGNMEDYSPGDLVLLGPNLPHYWVNETSSNSGKDAHSIVIKFEEDFLGASLLAKHDFKDITDLLKRSVAGIQFIGKTRDEALIKIQQLLNSRGLEKIIGFLALLNGLALSDEFRLLSPVIAESKSAKEASNTMEKVYKYILENFTEDVNLTKAADIANLSVTAFCQYFKKRTRKSFVSYVNEIRINHASRLLIEDDMNASQACYASGFNNISNFNRQFKAIRKYSPLEYKKLFCRDK